MAFGAVNKTALASITKKSLLCRSMYKQLAALLHKAAAAVYFKRRRLKQKFRGNMGKHRTVEQDKIFVEFMEKHADMGASKMGRSHAVESAWVKLTQKLNSAGPPIKDLNEWRRTWRDWRISIKKKIALNSEKLSPIEDAVAQVSNLYAAVDDEEDAADKKPARSKNMSLQQSFEADNSVSQSGNSKAKHRTALQDSILLDFMQQRPDLARNIKGDQLAIKSTWMKLAKKLNSNGPPFKEPNEWKNIWIDWKCRVKKKIAQNSYDSLTHLEKVLAQVANLYEKLNDETESSSDNEEPVCSKKLKRESSFDEDELLAEFLTDDSSKDPFSVEATNSTQDSYTIASKQPYNSVTKLNKTEPKHKSSQCSFEKLKDVKTIARELQKLNNQIKTDSKRNEAKNNAFLDIGKQMCQLMSQHIKEQQRLNDVLEKLTNKIAN